MQRPTRSAAFPAIFLLLALGPGEPGQAMPPGADAYAASLSLQDRWMDRTRDAVLGAWWVGEDGDFTYLASVEGGFAFFRENVGGGGRRPAFDQARLAEALAAALDEAPDPLWLPFTNFEYEGDGAGIALWLDGDRWRCDLREYLCAEAPLPGRPRGFGVVRDPRVQADGGARTSPDGEWNAFVRGANVVVEPAAGGEAIVLSRDGTAGNYYDPDSIRWSPDSRKLVALRVRPGHARYVTRVVSSPRERLQPALVEQLYPKPGDAVDLEQPVLFHVEARKQFEIADDLFPNPYLLRNLGWRKDSRSVAFEYTRRGHQLARLLEVDAESGEVRAVVTERTDTFIDLYRGFRHDVDGLGHEVIWLSERDGWRHLYLYDGAAGTVKNRITAGEWVVRSVLKVDDDRREVWFAASGMDPGEDPYFVHYYRVNFDGSGLTRLTAPGATHRVALSPDLEFFIVIRSRVDLPPVAELRRGRDGSLVRTLARADISRLAAAGFRPPEPFVAKGRDSETDIWGLIYRPRDFDPAGRYPVIEHIYSGPQGSFVQKDFWPFGTPGYRGKGSDMQALADLGFIVVQIDGMGTANRSKAFHDVAWKNLQDAGFPDRIAWHRAAAAEYPWYDTGRGVGIYGGSAGGQSALGALLFHPEFYTAAVAWAGCYDNRMDKIWWSEQWLGWPLDESYEQASGVLNAERLEGRLLLAWGEQDDNVDPATSLQLVNALIAAGKDFDMLVFPGVRHNFGRSAGLARYFERRKYDFFVESLMLGRATPAWNAADAR